MFEPLTVNRIVDITTPGSKSDSYRCKIKEISGERLFAVLPADIKDTADLIAGSRVKVTYTDSSAVYTFFTEIIALNQGMPLILIIGRPINMTRIQRRNFVRLDAKLRVVSSKIDEDRAGLESFPATTIDISGGGILFGCEHPLHIGELLEATIFIGENQTVTAVGRVVRVVEQSALSKYRFSVGLEFTVIKEAERDKIIKYIFNQQRELRTRGLL